MHLVFWVGENIATRLGCAPAGRLGGLGFDVDAISAVGGWGGALPCSSDDSVGMCFQVGYNLVCKQSHNMR